MFDFISSIILTPGFSCFNGAGIGGSSIWKKEISCRLWSLQNKYIPEITLRLCLNSEENDELAVIKVIGNNVKKPSGFWDAGQFILEEVSGF